jgi:TPP-dependent pyruvate/acetoin dehydrogenase alpha subunit
MGESGYRSQDEIDLWKTRDPIKRLHEYLLSNEVASGETLATIEAEVQARVEDAAEFAKNSPWPDPATALTHVYCEE